MPSSLLGGFFLKRILSLILIICLTLHPQTTTQAANNEKIIYRYLTETMGLKSSAACGILANIKRESDFKPTAYNSSDHFGLCQWGGVRKDRLIRWCRKKGYNYKSLKGQLGYINFQLKNYYPKVYRKLKYVKNTSYGAYDVGYYFCYNYEIPGNRGKSSITRGRLARKYFKKYR